MNFEMFFFVATLTQTHSSSKVFLESAGGRFEARIPWGVFNNKGKCPILVP